MSFEPVPLSLASVFRAEVDVGRVDDYGVTRAGHRRVVQILGGALSGEVEAAILPGGADWQIVHPDGRLEIDTRYSALTPSGTLLHLRAKGIRMGSPEVLESLLAGEEVPPSEYYFRIGVTIEVSDPTLAYLQNHLLIGSAVRELDRVVYDAYLVL